MLTHAPNRHVCEGDYPLDPSVMRHKMARCAQSRAHALCMHARCCCGGGGASALAPARQPGEAPIQQAVTPSTSCIRTVYVHIRVHMHMLLYDTYAPQPRPPLLGLPSLHRPRLHSAAPPRAAPSVASLCVHCITGQGRCLGPSSSRASAAATEHCFELTTTAVHKNNSACDPSESLCCTTPDASRPSKKVVMVNEVIVYPSEQAHAERGETTYQRPALVDGGCERGSLVGVTRRRPPGLPLSVPPTIASRPYTYITCHRRFGPPARTPAHAPLTTATPCASEKKLLTAWTLGGKAIKPRLQKQYKAFRFIRKWSGTTKLCVTLPGKIEL